MLQKAVTPKFPPVIDWLSYDSLMTWCAGLRVIFLRDIFSVTLPRGSPFTASLETVWKSAGERQMFVTFPPSEDCARSKCELACSNYYCLTCVSATCPAAIRPDVHLIVCVRVSPQWFNAPRKQITQMKSALCTCSKSPFLNKKKILIWDFFFFLMKQYVNILHQN